MASDQDQINKLESSLKALQPRSLDTSRERIMYLAGRASVRSRLWIRGAFTTLFGLMMGIGVTVFALQPFVGSEPKVVIVHVNDADTGKAHDIKNHEDPEAKKVSGADEKIDVVKSTPSLMEDSILPYLSYSNVHSTSTAGYLGLRNRVLRWGVEVLPAVQNTTSTAEDEPWSVLKPYEMNKENSLGNQ